MSDNLLTIIINNPTNEQMNMIKKNEKVGNIYC